MVTTRILRQQPDRKIKASLAPPRTRSSWRSRNSLLFVPSGRHKTLLWKRYGRRFCRHATFLPKIRHISADDTESVVFNRAVFLPGDSALRVLPSRTACTRYVLLPHTPTPMLLAPLHSVTNARPVAGPATSHRSFSMKVTARKTGNSSICATGIFLAPDPCSSTLFHFHRRHSIATEISSMSIEA